MNDVSVIKLKPKEWELYKKIRLEALKSDPIAFATTYEEATAFSDAKWKSRLTDSNNIFLFAKVDDAIVGTMCGWLQSKGKLSNVAAIIGVYVNKNYRGKGIGKLLMRALLKQIAVHKEIIKVEIYVSETQKPAISLYEKSGFSYVGRKKNEVIYKDKTYDELIMEKELKKKRITT